MRKNSHFSGQPLYGQVIKLLDNSKILDFSCKRMVRNTQSVSTAGFILL